MATFDEIFGNILDFDLEGIFNDVTSGGPTGNLINYLTGFDPAEPFYSAGTQELQELVQNWKDLSQDPYTRSTLTPTMPTANLMPGVEQLVPSQYEVPGLDYEALPDFSMLDLAGYDPTLYESLLPDEAALIGGSEQEANQARILEELMAKSEEGGFTDAERMMFNQILQGQARQAGRARDAALQNIQARGLGGSGMEAIMTAMANQAGAGEANRAGIQLALSAQDDNMEALTAAAGLSGQMRDQDFRRQATNVDAINTFNRLNSNAATAAAARNAQTQTEADRYRSEMSRIAKQYNVEANNRFIQENNRLANDSLKRQYEAELQQNQIYAQREMEAGKFNASTQMEIDSRNQAALNAFEMAKSQMANDFAKENVDNLFRVEKEENDFAIKRLTGQGAASKGLAEALFAEQKANLLKRAIEQQGGAGSQAVGGVPTVTQTGGAPSIIPTSPTTATIRQTGTTRQTGPSGPGGLYRPGDTITPGSEIERQLNQQLPGIDNFGSWDDMFGGVDQWGGDYYDEPFDQWGGDYYDEPFDQMGGDYYDDLFGGSEPSVVDQWGGDYYDEPFDQWGGDYYDDLFGGSEQILPPEDDWNDYYNDEYDYNFENNWNFGNDELNWLF